MTPAPRLTISGVIHPPTPRQLEIAAAVVRHGNRQRAADELGIALHTVRNQVTNLTYRTGARNFLGVLVALGWLRVPVDKP